MEISDADCEEFRQICLKNDGMELSVDETRETIGRLCLLYERMAEYLEKGD